MQFKSANIVDAVLRALEVSMIDPGRLELEITKGLLVKNLDQARMLLLDLKDLGVKLALDHLGSGYSSLSYLHMLQFDRIKSDRSFVAQLGLVGEAEAIVRAVVTLGQGLGMSTTAEGVEEDRQLGSLRDVGCYEA